MSTYVTRRFINITPLKRGVFYAPLKTGSEQTATRADSYLGTPYLYMALACIYQEFVAS